MARGNNVLQIIINGVNRAGPAFRQIGLQATRMGTVVGAALLGATYRAGQFEKGLAEISTLLDGDVAPAIQRTRKELLDLSMASGQAIGKLTKARYDIISAGFTDAADSAIVLDAATRLATAGVSDVARSADIVTSALGGFQLSAKESNRIVDVLFQTVRKGKTTLDQLAQGYGKVFSTAKVAGVGIEELSAAMATATTAGVNTREAITGLNALLLALAAPAEEAKEALAEAGITMEKGFLAALQAVNKTAGDSPAKLRELIPSIEALRVAAAVAGNIDLMTQNLHEMDNAAGVVDDGVAKMAKTFDYQLNRAKRALDALTIQIGTALLPKATQMIEMFTDLVVSIVNNEEKIRSLTITVAKWAAGITAAGVTLTTLSTVMGIIGPAVTAMGVAFATMSVPVQIAVVAISGLVATLIKYRKEIEEKLFPMASKFNEENEKTPGLVDQWLGTLKQAGLTSIAMQYERLALAAEQYNNMVAGWDDLFSGGKHRLGNEMVANFASTLREAAGAIHGVVAEGPQAIDDALTGGLDAAGENIKSEMEEIKDNVLGLMDEMLAKMQAKMAAVMRAAKPLSEIVFIPEKPPGDFLGPELPEGFKTAKERAAEEQAAAVKMHRAIGDARKKAAEEAEQAETERMENLRAQMASLAEFVTEDFMDMAFTAGAAFANVATQIGSHLLGLTRGPLMLGRAFKQMGVMVLNTLAQIIARMLVARALMSLFSFGVASGATIPGNFGSTGTGVPFFAHGGVVNAAHGRLMPGLGSDFPPIILPGSPGVDRTMVAARGGEMMISPETVRATETLLRKQKTGHRRQKRGSGGRTKIQVDLQANRPFRREEQVNLTDSVDEGFNRSKRHRG